MKETPWAEAIRQAQPALARPVLLVLDDERPTLEAMAMGMGKLGYSVLTRQAGHDFVTHHDLPALLDEVRPDCVLTDFQMGLVDGLDVAQAVHEHDAHMPLVLHTNALDALPANHPSLAYVSAMRPKPTQGELKRHCALVDNVFRSAMHNHGKADLFSNREHER